MVYDTTFYVSLVGSCKFSKFGNRSVSSKNNSPCSLVWYLLFGADDEALCSLMRATYTTRSIPARSLQQNEGDSMDVLQDKRG